MLTGIHSVLPLGACQLLISDVPVNFHHPCLPILAMLFAEDLYLGHQWLVFQFGCFYVNVYVLSFAFKCACSAQKVPPENLSGRWVLLGFAAFFLFLFFEDEHLHCKSDLCIPY